MVEYWLFYMGQLIAGKYLWESQREKRVCGVCVCLCVCNGNIAVKLVLYGIEIVSLLIKRWERKALRLISNG